MLQTVIIRSGKVKTYKLVAKGMAAGPRGFGLPPGGTAGQIPEKIDETDYNTRWVDPAGGGGGALRLVDSYESVGGESTVSFTGLSNKFYKVLIHGIAVAGANGSLLFRANGDASSVGYNSQRSSAFGSPSALSNSSDVGAVNAVWTTNDFEIDIAAVGSLMWRATYRGLAGSSDQFYDFAGQNLGVYNNITQLDFISTVALPAGWIFRIFEVQES